MSRHPTAGTADSGFGVKHDRPQIARFLAISMVRLTDLSASAARNRAQPRLRPQST
jgi:hypothetical protein